MKSRKAKYLLKTYPELFSMFIKRFKQPEHQFGVADGWYSIISDICSDIVKLRGEGFWRNNALIEFDASQMKEKFGTLRFYYKMNVQNESSFSVRFRKINDWLGTNMCKRGFYKKYWALDRFRRKYIYETLYEKVGNIIKRGEFKSGVTCEVCGGEGKRCTPNGWILTLCEKHEEETKKENSKWRKI